MKQYFFLLVTLSMLLLANAAKAQVTTPAVPAANTPLKGRNLIKFNVSGILLNTYDLQYERVLNKKQSIALTVGIAPNVPLPFKSTLISDFGGNEDAKRAIQTTVFTRYTATLEYRFYFSGHAPRGLYFAPFLRYMDMKLDQDYLELPETYYAPAPTHLSEGNMEVYLFHPIAPEQISSGLPSKASPV